jgi:hypothetical protein
VRGHRGGHVRLDQLDDTVRAGRVVQGEPPLQDLDHPGGRGGQLEHGLDGGTGVHGRKRRRSRRRPVPGRVGHCVPLVYRPRGGRSCRFRTALTDAPGPHLTAHARCPPTARRSFCGRRASAESRSALSPARRVRRHPRESGPDSTREPTGRSSSSGSCSPTHVRPPRTPPDAAAPTTPPLAFPADRLREGLLHHLRQVIHRLLQLGLLVLQAVDELLLRLQRRPVHRVRVVFPAAAAPFEICDCSELMRRSPTMTPPAGRPRSPGRPR